MGNNLKAFLLLGTISIILILIGKIAGGQTGLYLGFILTLIVNSGAYFYSDKITLAANSAKPLTRNQSPEIYAIVRHLSNKFGIPSPRLYITPDLQANAFATGRNPKHACLVLTSGLLHILSLEEIQAVLSHEMSHIKNRDILITSIAAVIAGSIAFLGNLGRYARLGKVRDNRKNDVFFSFLLILFAPITAALLHLVVSREREYEADITGARIMGNGEPLAQALLDINNSTKERPMFGINPAFSSLYTSNPLGYINKPFLNLYSTHPPIEERINRLKQMRF